MKLSSATWRTTNAAASRSSAESLRTTAATRAPKRVGAGCAAGIGGAAAAFMRDAPFARCSASGGESRLDAARRVIELLPTRLRPESRRRRERDEQAGGA